MTTTTLDPAGTYHGLNVSDLTFSNGNCTVSLASAANLVQVCGANPLSTGKYYFEVSLNNAAAQNSQTGFGIVATGATSYGGGSSHTFWYQYCPGGAELAWNDSNSQGYLCINGNSNSGLFYVAPTISDAPASDTVGIAVDFDNKLIWFTADNGISWNLTNHPGNGIFPANYLGNPTAGTGGIDISAITGPFVPFIAFESGAAGAQATFNFAPQDGVAPAGFGGWPATGSTAVTLPHGGFSDVTFLGFEIAVGLPFVADVSFFGIEVASRLPMQAYASFLGFEVACNYGGFGDNGGGGSGAGVLTPVINVCLIG